MRLIDADALKLNFIANLCGHGTCLNPTGQAEVGFMIDEAKTIDAVPVVRCKDCINYNTDNCCDGFGWCENLGIGVHDNFFCKIGERKKNG